MRNSTLNGSEVFLLGEFPPGRLHNVAKPTGIKFIMGIGIPGSGKTTLLRSFAARYGYEYISADEVRAELLIPANDPIASTDNPITINMWEVIRKKVEKSLRNGQTIVLDATFARKELRIEFIQLARKNGATKIQGVFVDTPAEVAWERGKNRERQISERVFKERVDSLKKDPPISGDGFDTIFTVKQFVKIERKGKNKILLPIS